MEYVPLPPSLPPSHLPPFLSLLSSECLFQINPGLLGFPVGLFLFQVPPKIIWRCSSFQFCSLEWPACFTKQREKSVLRSVVWWDVHTFRFLLIHFSLMLAHELGTIELLFSKNDPFTREARVWATCPLPPAQPQHLVLHKCPCTANSGHLGSREVSVA